jgi:AmmeMemoRadiSam system protein A
VLSRPATAVLEPSLSAEERKALLQLARDSVVHAVSDGRLPPSPSGDGIFRRQRGVFVTLYVLQKIRGCIGVVEPSEPLGEAIMRCAVCAAVQDPRFSPVRPAELSELRIEISVLSSLKPVRPDQIEIGRHGLLVAGQGRRGVLLPQVAVERHLSPEQFLVETCRKAELPPQAWHDAATSLFAFTCEVFSDRL